MSKSTALPAPGSLVILRSWSGVVFTVISHGPGMIHVSAKVPRGILSTSATVGEFRTLNP